MQKHCSISNNKQTHHYLKKLKLYLDAGMPLSRAMLMQKDVPAINELINEGKGLAYALKRCGFDGVAASLIGSGERTGDLAGAIGKALEMLDKRETLKKKVISALTYPSIVILFSMAVIILMTIVFVPNMLSMYGSLSVGSNKPGLLIINIVNTLPVLLISMILALSCLIYYFFSDRGFAMPVIGPLRRKYIASHLSSFMGMSLSAGVPLKETAEFSLDLFESGWYKRGIKKAVDAIQEGMLFSQALSMTGLYDDRAVSMMNAGECSSSLERVLKALAQIYEEEVEDSITFATKLIEPISTLATGAIVGIIVFAMVEPMVRLMDIMGV